MRRRAVCAILVVGAFLLGTYTAAKGLPPFDLLYDVYADHHVEIVRLLPDDVSARIPCAQEVVQGEYPGSRSDLYGSWNSVHPLLKKTRVDRVVTVDSEKDVERTRIELRRYVWGTDSVPSITPDVVERDVSDRPVADIGEDVRVDRLTVRMDWSVESVLYRFAPRDGAARGTVIYHQGHTGGIRHGGRVIRALLGEGYSVVGIAMPLHGPNNQPVVETQFGAIHLVNHNRFWLLPDSTGSPLHLFLTPVAAAVNEARSRQPDVPIFMTGISGGGWTTHLYAALDPRVEASYPVAGMLPMFLRQLPRAGLNHYENVEPGLYQRASKLDIFLLGAHGRGRRQIQMLNRCDWAGNPGYRLYADMIDRRLDGLGSGEFGVHYSSSPIHAYSERALSVMLEDMARETSESRPSSNLRSEHLERHQP